MYETQPLKQGCVPDWTLGSSPREALKMRRCTWLDLWIFPAFCSGSALRIALKTGRCSKLDPNILCSFLTCYYPHTYKESVSPVCGIVHSSMQSLYEQYCFEYAVFLKANSVVQSICADWKFCAQKSIKNDKRNMWNKKNMVKVWEIHNISASLPGFLSLSPKFAHIIKYLAQSCDCMIEAFRNSVNKIYIYCI